MKIAVNLFVVFGLLVGILGCSDQTGTNSNTTGHGAHNGEPGKVEPPVAPSKEGRKFVLDQSPENPQEVIAARESVEDGEEVVILGRIGGSADPWIEGRAIFTLVDNSLKSCDQIPGDNCPVPWDYCCATDKLPQASALVKVVDESEQPVKTDARELLGVRELTEVVVQGKAKRDDGGNLTVLASKIHVKK
jgi:hypothetical protein